MIPDLYMKIIRDDFGAAIVSDMSRTRNLLRCSGCKIPVYDDSQLNHVIISRSFGLQMIRRRTF